MKLMQEVADFLDIDIQHFAENTNVTTDAALSPTMKTFYDKSLIENAKAKLVHDQFGQMRDIPANNGKIIEFRRWTPFAKATTALSEGVTPDGQKMTITNLTATVKQYGGYVTLSDMLAMTAFDDNIAAAVKGMSQQAGDTLDTITREIINGGDNVQFADGQVAARYLLVGGSSTAANNHYLSVDSVRRVVRKLKIGKANPYSGGDFVAVIHPDTAYDIMGDTKWSDWNKYTQPEHMYQGEIGKIHGVRFVETTEAKIFHAADLVADGSTNEARTLTVASAAAKVVTIDEALSAAEATALAGRKVIIDGYLYTLASAAAGAAGAATITVTEAVVHAPADDDVVYPGEAGTAGRDVYSTLFIGADAYGVTKVSGGGLQTFVKQLGSAGAADPLNQRSTVGWKAIKTAVILTDAFMVRVETASTFQSGAN